MEDNRYAELLSRIESLQTVSDERDRRYTELRLADSEAVKAALAAAQQAISSAMAAADKANEKSETNDKAWREQQNEWRGSLEDILNRAVPRQEYDINHKALDEKFDLRMKLLETRMDLSEKDRELIRGRNVGLNQGWGYLIGLVAVISTLIGIFIAFR